MNSLLSYKHSYIRLEDQPSRFITVIIDYYVVKGEIYRQAKDADGKFCLGKRCQRQPSANHIYVRKRLIDA